MPSIHTPCIRGWCERPTCGVLSSVTLTVAGDGFMVDYAGQADQSGLLFRLFESPRVSERAYFSALSVGQIEYRYANGSAIWITLYFTPETARSTHVFATLACRRPLGPTLVGEDAGVAVLAEGGSAGSVDPRAARSVARLFPGPSAVDHVTRYRSPVSGRRLVR